MSDDGIENMASAPDFCMLWINWWPLCMQKSEWASWVQALGAIAGIGLAIFLSRNQAKEAAALQGRARVERLTELYAPAIAILTSVVGKLSDSYNIAIKDRSQGAFGVTQSFYDGREQLQEAFNEIPLHQMPTVESALLILRGKELFAEADQIMNEVGSKFDTMLTVTKEDNEQFLAHLTCWHRVIEALSVDLELVKKRKFKYTYRDTDRPE